MCQRGAADGLQEGEDWEARQSRWRRDGATKTKLRRWMDDEVLTAPIWSGGGDRGDNEMTNRFHIELEVPP